MKKINRPVILLGLMLAYHVSASACVCDLPLERVSLRKAVAKAKSEAAAVFSGHVIELDDSIVKFSVKRLWKGPFTQEIVLINTGVGTSENGNRIISTCAYNFRLGEKYLVYAYGSEAALQTNKCTRTGLLEDAAEDVGMLQNLGSSIAAGERSRKELVAKTGSMLPNIPFNSRLLIDETFYSSQAPRRFDIVVARRDYEHSINTGPLSMQIVARVVGLPGEVVSVRRGAIYINGRKQKEPFPIISCPHQDEGNLPCREMAAFRIPAEHYFLLADNRPESEDSRLWLPRTIPRHDVVGKVIKVLEIEAVQAKQQDVSAGNLNSGIPEEFKPIDFKNFSYRYRFPYGRPMNIVLKNGEYEYDIGDDRGWFNLSYVSYTDVTNDGIPEAIVILSHVSCGVSCDGGAGLFYIYTVHKSKLKPLWQYENW